MAKKKEYFLTEHAKEEAIRRGIPLKLIDEVIQSPEQIVSTYSNRKIYQSRIEFDDKLYLVRIIVEETSPLTVITVYRTSNIKKYWSDEA
ncbi:MAG: DUF4258 domain-containing protein [Chloroflexi bacterium]|nr:MAG: DUF4258 domain-containing protein [Chloroflexota bacterium]